MFFNFHTHNSNERFGIINIYPHESNSIEAEKLYSCGIHPWQYEHNYFREIQTIKNLANNNKIIAIGETGFDTKSKLDIAEQSKIFKLQVEISEKYKLPLIIHCVKFHNELIQLKKILKPKQSWILHGFNSKLSIANQLIKSGIYLSVSYNIFENEEKIKLFFQNTPIDNIFFETDDSNQSIDNIYISASKILKTNTDSLHSIILKNLDNIGINI